MSQCREAFKERVRQNDQAKRDAKAKGTRVEIKRIPVQPRGAQVVDTSKTTISFMNPIKFRELY